MDQLREKMLQETEVAASKARFGLFSQPPPLSLGRPYYESKPGRKDANGKVPTGLKNITASHCSSGQVKSSFFSYPEYMGNPPQVTRKRETQVGEAKFKPSSGYRSIISSAYEYISEGQGRPRPPRSPQDKGLRTITTNPSSYISKYLYPNPEHLPPSPLKKVQSQPRLVLEPFRNRVRVQAFFDPISKLYDETAFSSAPRKESPRPRPAEHFKPSSPSKSGYEGAFQPFPEHMPCPPDKPKGQQEHFKWKPKGPELLSRPSPSISLNRMNIIQEMK
jgi:hypothetical protein